VHQKSLQSLIRELLDSLPHRQASVIRMRFGIDCDEEYSLAEIGEVMGLSRERIRQIEVQALTKLRCPERIRRLAGSI
jgi:RNA polymerase primary sigma factor